MFFTGVIFSPTVQGQPGLFENPLIGQKAPDFTLATLAGDKVSMAEFRDGKKAIIFFWATWCPHCRRALSVLKDKHDEFRKKGVTLIPVDSGEPPAQVRAYLEKAGIDMEMFLDEHQSLTESYNVFGIPMLIFVDKEGVIRGIKHSLPADYEKLLENPRKERG